jgi:DNA-binding transcriptional LysR family regulator
LFGILRRPDWATDIKEELLFANHYVVVGRVGHPLFKIKRPTLRDLSRYDWIMPGPMTPRQKALHRILENRGARTLHAHCQRNLGRRFSHELSPAHGVFRLHRW